MPQPYLGEDLIFVISQPRSGSTLLQRVLSGHPLIQTSAETWLMLHPIYGLRAFGVESEFNSQWATTAVTEFLDNYTDGRSVYFDAIREWARVIYQNALARSGKTYFLDKTPRYYFIVNELYRLFPRAKFIFLIRNPMAVLASELTSYVTDNLSQLSLLRSDLLVAPQKILQGIDHLGDDAIVIRYEELVARPEQCVAALCERLGVTFFGEMLDYSRTPVPKGKMNDHIGIHQHSRPSTESLDKWHAMSGDPQSCHFARSYLEELGRDMIERLGYSFDEIQQRFPDNVAGTSSDRVLAWDIAIQPESQRTMREWYSFERYEIKRRSGMIGAIRGELSAGRRTLRRVLKGRGRTL